MKQGSSYKKLCIGNIRIHRRLLSYCTHSTVVTSSLCEITTIISSLTMLSRTASIVARRVTPARVSFAAAAAPRSFSSEAAASSAASSVTLNLSVPYESIYKGAAVDSVIIPGTEGEYGITVNHVPYVAQMKPGVLQVLFEGSEPEKYFVAGGFAVTHENSVTDVVCVEAVKLDDIDPSAVQSNYDAAKSAAGAATPGSVEEAEAMIDMEVNKAMGLAVGLSLA